jgi:hemerythrin superfamily protein
MPGDAITLLKQDHKEVKAIFREFQKRGVSQARKGELVNKMIELLTAHTYIENEAMYPEVRRLLPALEDEILESYEEHHVADILLIELSALKPDDERFDAKTTVLIESVTHHIEEEETDWFPKVREGLSRKQLLEIGERMRQLKAKAPRRPQQPSALKKAIEALTA